MAGVNGLLCAGLLLIIASASCVPMDQLYPFGEMAGDTELSPPPSSSSAVVVSARVDLPDTLLFFAEERDSVYVRYCACLLH